MSDVVKFNSQDMVNKLRDDVTKLVVSAIPQEAIDGMIQESYKSYFQATDHYRDSKSKFRQDVDSLIMSESRRLIQEHVTTALKDPVLLADLTKKVIEEAMPELTSAMVKGMANNLLQMIGNTNRIY